MTKHVEKHWKSSIRSSSAGEDPSETIEVDLENLEVVDAKLQTASFFRTLSCCFTAFTHIISAQESLVQ